MSISRSVSQPCRSCSVAAVIAAVPAALSACRSRLRKAGFRTDTTAITAATTPSMNQRNLITMSASQTSPGTLLAPLPV